MGNDDGLVVVPQFIVEEVVKVQFKDERCSPVRYYPFNDRAWALFEEKTGKRP